MTRTRCRMISCLLSAMMSTSGCSPAERSLLREQEMALGTYSGWGGMDRREFHLALHRPNGLALRHPGYLVGIEGAYQRNPAVQGPAVVPSSLVATPPGTSTRLGNAIHRLRTDKTAPTLTHIVRTRIDQRVAGNYALSACVLYSHLSPVGTGAAVPTEPFRLCPTMDQPAVPHGSAFAAGAIAVDRLRASIAADLATDGFTHLIALAMGWNSPPRDAVVSFNEIIANLVDEADQRGLAFSPLVVGITWPSDWTIKEGSLIPARLVRLLSFRDKRLDAYDVGITWAKAILEGAVLTARNRAAPENQVPLIVIGHSFGARMLHTAIAGPQALSFASLRADPPWMRIASPWRPGDHVFLLQAALAAEDLRSHAGDGPLREPYRSGLPRATVTASAHDTAVTEWERLGIVLDIDPYLGSMTSWRSWCLDDRAPEGVACDTIAGDPSAGHGRNLCDATEAPGIPHRRQGTVRYLDASAMINCPTVGGHGAHGDIQRRELADFLLSELVSGQSEGVARVADTPAGR